MKFVPPSPPMGFIARPRLIKAVARGLGGRLILVRAPAGYGKTSLLAMISSAWTDLRAEANLDPPTWHRPAWYQLEPSDDDASRLIGGLVEATRQVVSGIGGATLAALAGSTYARADLQRLLGVLQDELRAAGGRRLFVIMDGYHHLSDKAIHQLFEEVLRDPESPLSLIVASETEPPFYLSHLKSRGTLVEISEDDLRFTADEVLDLVTALAGRAIPQQAVASVVRETRGWPSASFLASLLVARTGETLPFTRLAPTEHGYSQLVRAVLDRFAAGHKLDLWRSSLLRAVEPDGCRQALGMADPDSLFAHVKAMPLPIMLLPGNRWAFRYDPMFRAALQRELASSVYPQEFRAVQREIAAHHRDKGDYEEAFRDYLQAWAYEEAAGLVQRVAAAEIRLGRADTVLRWLRSLPNLNRKGHPRLVVYEARAMLAKGDVAAARALLVSAQPELEAARDHAGLALRQSSVVALYLADARYAEVPGVAARAMKLLEPGDREERSDVHYLLAEAKAAMGELGGALEAASEGLLESELSGRQAAVVRAMQQIGRISELQGSYTRAIAMAGRAVRRAFTLDTETLVWASEGGRVAAMHLDRGQLEPAEELAASAVKYSRMLCLLDGEAHALLAKGLLAGARGDPTSALRLVHEAASLSSQLPPRSTARVSALQALAVALLGAHRRKEALEAVRAAVNAARETGQQVLVRRSRLLEAAVEAGANPASMLAMRRVRDGLAEVGDMRWLAGAHYLHAQASSRFGLAPAAKESLARGLGISLDEGYVGMPMELPFDREKLFVLAAGLRPRAEVAGPLLGVDPARAERLLATLLSHKSPEVREAAERAHKGVQVGAGRRPGPRLVWPGLRAGEASSGSVALQSLGGILAFVDGHEVDWPSVDARHLAAYLIVNRAEAKPVDRVLADLWPGAEPAAALVALQVALYQLRETLGEGYPDVELDSEVRGHYLWQGEGCLIDVERFRALCSGAMKRLESENPPVLTEELVATLEAAVRIYQGEFLAGVDFEWCGAQREELRSQLLWATRLLMDHYMALRGWRAAIPHGLKSLRSDPLQEDVVRDLMVCYFRSGDRNAVKSQYREVKRLLARDRGAQPTEETRQVRIRLLGR